MFNSLLKDKSYAFAIRIVNLSIYLSSKRGELVLSKQVLRSGTSIGAMIREAEHAESRSDFTHKLSIALKEANETHYWLCLLKDTKFISPQMFDSISRDCEELLRMLTSAVKKSKQGENK